MSTAKPMSPTMRMTAYAVQNSPYGDPFYQGPFTPAQNRRDKHKRNKALGMAGSGTMKPRQVKTRQRRPAPVPGGLIGLLSPKQLRKAVGAHSALKGIKFKLKERRPDVMIIDDLQRPTGKGDR